MRFDTLFLISVIILFFLLTYKIVDKVIEFKNSKNISITEILFLCAFASFLFIPTLYITDAKESKSEHRTLAKWENFITADKRINYKFGKNFDNWFNDRFFLRENLLRFYYNLKSALNYKFVLYDNVSYNKKAKMLFYNYFKKDYIYNPEEIAASLNRFYSFCDKSKSKV